LWGFVGIKSKSGVLVGVIEGDLPG
jgi:hypothetical protein